MSLLHTTFKIPCTDTCEPESIVRLYKGNNDVDNCLNRFNVLLEKKVTYVRGNFCVTNEYHGDTCSIWSTSKGTQINVELLSFDKLPVEKKFRMKKIDPTKGGKFNALRDGTVEISVPEMVNRQQNDENTIDTIIQTALEKVASSNVKVVAFLISAFANWDFDSIMKCMVNSFVDWLLRSATADHFSVTLCVENGSDFASTNEYFGSSLWNKMKDRDRDKIRIIQGHLDKACADVIVNTVAPDLNLSYGKVSRALLQAAGPKLQDECKRHFPHGITPDIIAVTGGYELKCKSVFHITLQRRDTSSKGYIQSIRDAMLLCLKTASDYNYESIAFPAMGTGSLKYPTDEVASEMVMALERFAKEYKKAVPIKEVQIIIFPNDRSIFQTFQKMVNDLVKAASKTEVNLIYEMTGRKENVVKCKSWFENTLTTKAHGQEYIDLFSQQRSATANHMTGHKQSLQSYCCGNISINICIASVLDIPADCIVTFVSPDFELRGGGENYKINECLQKERSVLMKQRDKLSVGSIVQIRPDDIKLCQCMLFAVGPDLTAFGPSTSSSYEQFQQDLNQTVLECLKQASTLGYKTIVFPIVRSGTCRVPVEVFAAQYAKAVKEFSSRMSSILEIYFVDNRQTIIDVFNKTLDTMIRCGGPLYSDSFDVIEQNTNVDEADKAKTVKNTGRDRPGAIGTEVDNHPGNIPSRLIFSRDNQTLMCEIGGERGVEVLVYCGDIINLKNIDAIVCSENRIGYAKGIVARLLFEQGGEDYQQEKESVFKNRRRHFEIITTKGGRNNYRWIVHAVMPRKDPSAIPKIYKKIFEEVAARGFTSVSLPLLGTGVGDVDPRTCTEMLLSELVQFCQTNGEKKLTLHLVINDKLVEDHVKKVFITYIEKMKNEQERNDNGEHVTEEIKDGPSNDQVEDDADCVICMDKVTDEKKLPCGHRFCAECIEGYFKVRMVCPTCGKVCGIVTGDQPDGCMDVYKHADSVAGFEKHKSIVINYAFDSGIQKAEHPNPGVSYKGIRRNAYLPDNKEGRQICAMLIVAFERRLIFTIGTSRTTGKESVITWNDVHHKTDMRPNTQFGYPDDTYLQRVGEELKVKGVTLGDVDKNLLKELEDDSFRKLIRN